MTCTSFVRVEWSMRLLVSFNDGRVWCDVFALPTLLEERL